MTTAHTDTFFKKFIKDPLFHFLLLGVGLYFISIIWDESTQPKNRIQITQLEQTHLADLFEITWQRPPSAGELTNLISEHIKEEVYYREALALGLDNNDTIVRRRMRQKLEFMQEDLSAAKQASEQDLKKYYVANKDKYFTNHLISFSQALVSTGQGKQSQAVTQAVEKLQNGVRPAQLSLSSLLPVSLNLETKKSIANTFGDGFLQQILQLETHTWHGPISSAFGTHVVYVNQNQAAKPLNFEAARTKINIDLIQMRREQSAEQYYQTLKDKYHITIEDTP